jgi:hypothetical protein
MTGLPRGRAVLGAALGLGLLGCTSVKGGEGMVAAPAPAAASTRPSTLAQPVATSPLPTVSGDRRIMHAMSRLTYGARPGDVERVRAMGLSVWIDRQLRPATIDDSATETTLTELSSPGPTRSCRR